MKKNECKVNEPFVRVSKRGVAMPVWKAFSIRGIALVAALAICAIIIFAIVKMNPLKVYGAMFEGAFGTDKRMWVTIRDMMMLLCIAIGLAPRIPDAILEHRSGRPDFGRRHCFRGLHDLFEQIHGYYPDDVFSCWD